METMKIGEMELFWLNGEIHTWMAVPCLAWCQSHYGQKYPVNDRNQIELRCDPMLIRWNGLHLLVDSGIGSGS